ncbi:MAG: hypothetical protein HFI48_07430 [Lachnospiraceae bacterium]|nr:hypothetical protein [Lachnospiraceae bacterium]
MRNCFKRRITEMSKQQWMPCPVCGNKTRTILYENHDYSQ